MRYFSYLLLISALCATTCTQNSTTAIPPRPEYALAIHGGAGAISRKDMTPEKEARYRAALDSALTVGENLLKNGASALDAVSATVVFLENCPLFNAGKGAVFTHEGINELDASIMDGTTQKAGAVGSVTVVKNPILLARAVMEKSPHVFLTGRGAEQFAREQGLEIVDPSYFFTKERYDYWKSLQPQPEQKQGSIIPSSQSKMGTVGCVALDKSGHLAAATSTGGMTDKRWNRIGDTPVIGAGTWADDATCAISCTGHGEFFIRYAVAHDVHALMDYKKLSLTQATDEVVMHKLRSKGGEGGLIAIDKNGNIAQPFNSEGMYRGWAKSGVREVAIYKTSDNN